MGSVTLSMVVTPKKFLDVETLQTIYRVTSLVKTGNIWQILSGLLKTKCVREDGASRSVLSQSNHNVSGQLAGRESD